MGPNGSYCSPPLSSDPLDLYSFHQDEECARQTYEQVCSAYERIFKKLGLNCYKGREFSRMLFLLMRQ